jgi:NNP family nitrate/nitrite transporter-like MFS transporter
MDLRGFLRSGHTPTLVCAFLYFDISFMVWVLLGALANSIVPELELTPSQRGFMVAVPILGGAVLRVGLGWLTDYIGARKSGLIGLVLTIFPLLLGWLWTDSFEKLLVVGFLLGIAGASFAAALPLASRWYPPKYQGLAMGIAGAGNSGTAIATFFAPRLVEWTGSWNAVLGLALIPLIATLVLFFLFAKDSPNQPEPKPWKDYATVLAQRDTWWFCVLYSVTFGGFVGLASFLNSYFSVEYGLDPVNAGMFATLCVVSGSLLRPVGGYLSDRFGGVNVLMAIFAVVGVLVLAQAAAPPIYLGAGLLLLIMGGLGMGNGAVFQLVPQRFSSEIGIVTGIVGAAGGVGGFFLPSVLGMLKQTTDSFAGGFLLFALSSLGCVCIVILANRRWEGVFVAKGGRAAVQEPEPQGVVT